MEEYIIETSETLEQEEEEAMAAPPKRKRNREPDPDSWLKNQRKKMRSLGMAYVDSRGKPRPERRVRPKDCSSCRKKCTEVFSEEAREKVHQSFWGLADNEKQKLFISTLVEEEPKKRSRVKGESRRSVTRAYFLRCGKARIPVCQGFFLATLDVSEAVVKNILKNRDETTYFPRESLQGRNTCSRARPETAKDMIRQHIRSYLPEPEAGMAGSSKDTPKKKKKKGAVVAQGELSGDKVEYILAPGLNVRRMWDSYVDQCQWSSTPPEKEWLYRDILTKEFNIKFSDPTQKRDKVVAKQEQQEEVEQVEGDVQVQYPGQYTIGAQVGYSNIHYGYP